MRAEGQKRTARAVKYGVALWFATTVAMMGGVEAAQQGTTGGGYSRTSWGLGVVVPDGASLAGGGTLSWGNARNLTALVQIPSLVNVTRATYAIVSLMTLDGFVLQAAAGVFPGNSSWLAYSMFIADVQASPQTYHWVLNSSAPRMSPRDTVAISIFYSQVDGWSCGFRDLDSGSSVQRSFGAAAHREVRTGDQEVFALESYSRDSSTFAKMGNLTLVAVVVDGKSVSGGWYSFADWEAGHNPLFVVGGATPPQFISFSRGRGVLAVWSYAPGWNGVGEATQVGLVEAFVVFVAAAAGVAAIAWFALRRGCPQRGAFRVRNPNRLK